MSWGCCSRQSGRREPREVTRKKHPTLPLAFYSKGHGKPLGNCVKRGERVHSSVNKVTLAAGGRAGGREAKKKRLVRRAILNPIKQFTILNISIL